MAMYLHFNVCGTRGAHKVLGFLGNSFPKNYECKFSANLEVLQKLLVAMAGPVTLIPNGFIKAEFWLFCVGITPHSFFSHISHIMVT